MKRAFLAILALVCWLAPARALANVSAEIVPILGDPTTVSSGWATFLVRLSNGGSTPAQGKVEVSAAYGMRSGEGEKMEAAYAVGPGSTVNLRLPLFVPEYSSLDIVVRDAKNTEITRQSFSASNQEDVVMFEVSERSPLRVGLDDLPIVTGYSMMGYGRSSRGPMIQLTSPRFDSATGDPILPERPAGYANVAVVLLRSDVLSRLRGEELHALTTYVLGGGTLAVVIARPEDLRNETLVALVGGAVTKTSVHSQTLRPLFVNPASAAGSSKTLVVASDPSAKVADSLVGYSGGNLEGSPQGATASYGLGEVVLLAFDTSRPEVAADTWALGRVVDLSRRAFDRRASVIFASSNAQSYGRRTTVAQFLDPNERGRWGIGVAALLLLVYAIVVGPVNFGLAKRAGKPLTALRRLPIISGAAFMVIVAVGFFSRGTKGRARHLSFIDAGAGMTEAVARRYRGFYSGESERRPLRPLNSNGVLRADSVDGEGSQRLTIDRGALRLDNLVALPWETLVVRDDGVAGLGGGIAITADGGDTTITNRSGRALRAVIYKFGADDPVFFDQIDDGGHALVSKGQRMNVNADERSWSAILSTPSAGAGALPLHGLGSADLPSSRISGPAPRLIEALRAIEGESSPARDWFPPDVPVVIAQIDGGEGMTHDGGLRIDSDMTIVRVVGWGGRP